MDNSRIFQEDSLSLPNPTVIFYLLPVTSLLYQPPQSFLSAFIELHRITIISPLSKSGSLADSFMILEIEISTDGSRNFFSKCFLWNFSTHTFSCA